MWYRQVFEVQGNGHFPIDMLRYDRCTPEQQTDVGTIEFLNRDGFSIEARNVRLVRFVHVKSDVPTADRWKSFGWKVVSESIMSMKI